MARKFGICLVIVLISVGSSSAQATNDVVEEFRSTLSKLVEETNVINVVKLVPEVPQLLVKVIKTTLDEALSSDNPIEAIERVFDLVNQLGDIVLDSLPKLLGSRLEFLLGPISAAVKVVLTQLRTTVKGALEGHVSKM